MIPHIGWQPVLFQEAWSVLSKQRELEFDIETPVTDQICKQKPTVYSFGIPYGGDRYVFDLNHLQDHELAMLHYLLASPKVLKLIHNAQFENMLIYYHFKVVMESVYCTMLAEMIIDSGNETVGYGLADTVQRRFNYNISKILQKSFGDGIVSSDQIEYAADDVAWLGFVKRQQMLELHAEDLEWVAALEMDATLAYSEMTAEGFKLDKEKWIANEHLAAPVVEMTKLKMDSYLQVEPFHSYAVKNKFLITEETSTLNWNSHQQVRRMFDHYFPDVGGATKKIVEQYIKKASETGGSVRATKLQAYLDKDYATVLEYWKSKDKEFLYNEGVLLLPGHSLVNWNSVDQVLPFSKLVHKNLKDLSAESVAKTTHQFFLDLTEYKDALKLTSTYGQAFFKHVEDDGMVRSRVKQIVSTGRISMNSPNMQQIPAKEYLENRYRNAFIPHSPDWKIVDSDFASQELVIIAHLSKDPVWIEALNQGKDLHSVCAELVFKDKWKNAADADCKFYAKGEDGTPLKAKCKCKSHKKLRDGVKTINFG